MTQPEEVQLQNDALWYEMLTKGHKERFALLPSNPRCNICFTPFGGIGGKITSLFGYRPSRKNPNFCNY